MLSGFNDIHPVNFVYQNDIDLQINQNTFETQQGLSLNLVNALSGCKDEAIINYSNIFLSQPLPVNDILYIPPKQQQSVIFPTYLALSAIPVSAATRYVGINSSTALSSSLTFNTSLSNQTQNYFIFTDLNGLQCRVSTIDKDKTKNLTVNYNEGNTLYFSTETPTISVQRSNIFEYSLDGNGYLKLFHRTPTNFYIIRNVGSSLSAVDVTNTTPLTTDIVGTTYLYDPEVAFKNNFIYYDKNDVKIFKVNERKTVEDIPQNHVLFYNYQSHLNFLSGSTALVDFFKTKNVLSNDYFINNKLPFGKNDVVQREYTTILSKQNSELYNGDLQLNYNYYTKEYLFIPDASTRFTLPETLYPYSVINVDNSSLVNNGAYGGLSPVFSDKIIKNLNPNTNAVNYNEANGIYLYTWLYTDANQLTSYWLDRYYYPLKTSLNVAYSGSNNQVFNYTSALSAFLSAAYPQSSTPYYDIRSSLTLEPSASYIYSRIGNKYINKVVNTFPIALSSIPTLDSNNVVQGFTNNFNFDGNTYGTFKLNPDDNNSFTISFDLKSENIDNIKSGLVLGNNFDEGLSIYKGGKNNIFTPGYFVCALSGVDFFDVDNNLTFSINVSSFVGAPVKVIDVINVGFDHLIKVVYINTITNIPGFLDISIYNKVYNKYDFPELANAFNSGDRINIYDRTYVGDSQIWYLAKFSFPYNRIYKFDYYNNLYLGSQPLSVAELSSYNSFVMYKNLPVTLSGFKGDILDSDLGVSKFYNSVYFKNLSTNTEYQVLCANGGIFDLLVDGDKFFVQGGNEIKQYDRYKRLYNTYTNNSSAVSGLKLDLINHNFETKLLSYTVDSQGHILVDRFDIDTTTLESSYNTGVLVNPQYFGEFYTPTRGLYNQLVGIGIVDGSYISGGIINDYTYSNPIIGSLTAVDIDAIVGAVSYDSGTTSSLTGTLTLLNGYPIPTDVNLTLYKNGTIISSVSGDGISTSSKIVLNNITPQAAYTLRCNRTIWDTVAVKLTFDIGNGTFYNGSFRNVIVGENYTYPGTPGFANALYAINNIGLTNQLGFVATAESYKLNSNFGLITPIVYTSKVNFNGITNQNPYNNFYHAPSNPHLQLVVNPDLSSFQPNLISFTSNLNPPVPTLSGIPLQSPTNFETILDVNKFDKNDFVARIDLFSGNNYLNKQTKITPFSAENNSQILISFDVVNGFVNIYNNAELISTISLSADTFFSSYFLGNDFGVGVPFIDNKAASVLYPNQLAKNYSIENLTVYDRPLNEDEVKFNYLKNKNIDPVNFDITAGTRNDTDTVTSFNKMVIPGRKNNSAKIYIKNAYLNENGKADITAQLIEKLKTVLPINVSNVDIQYIDYD